MDPLPIRTQIRARILELLTPLKADGTVRKVEWKKTLFQLEEARPCIHLVCGQETVLGADEDFRGYTMELPIFIRLMFSGSSEFDERMEALEAKIQKAIEGDVRLNALANRIYPEGSLPFVDEVQKPDGGVILTYVVEYRRGKADPYTTY